MKCATPTQKRTLPQFIHSLRLTAGGFGYPDDKGSEGEDHKVRAEAQS